MRTESEVRAARDDLREMVRQCFEVGGPALCELATGPDSALVALSWVLGDDAPAAAKFDHLIELTDRAVRDLRAVDKAEAERN
jgi:hypothetical protein